MTKLFLTQASAVLGVALVTFGLYAWGAAGAWAQQADRVEAAAWSVRCLAAAAIAAAQLLFALSVLPALFSTSGARGAIRRGPIEQAYALAMGLLSLLALVVGGALGAAAGW